MHLNKVLLLRRQVNASFKTRSLRRHFSAETKPKIGFIGTGVMGTTGRINAGYSTTVYSRTKSKAQGLLDKGASWADSPRALAERSDIVLSIVGFPKDVKEVVLGSNGILAGLKPGGIVVDMTTSAPSLALEIAQEARKKSCFALDAPVSGGDLGAREARLTIMAGGDKETFDKVLPVFSVIGKTIKLLGPAGSGQHTKAVNQILIATTMIGLVEGLLYGYKAGLNLEDVIATVSQGAAGSASLNLYGLRILQGNYEPGFFVQHFIKDMEIVKQETRRMGIILPGLELALNLYSQLKDMGNGLKGTQALMIALERLNRVTFVPPLKEGK